MQQMGLTPGQVLPGQVPAVVSASPSASATLERSVLNTVGNSVHATRSFRCTRYPVSYKHSYSTT